MSNVVINKKKSNQNKTEKTEKKDFKKPEFKGNKKPNNNTGKPDNSGKPNNNKQNNHPPVHKADDGESYRPFALFFKKNDSGKYEYTGKDKK
jgi:hypothetical protein